MSDLREQLQSTLANSYTFERELGGGGMSRVFLAEETALGRRVVVKVLSPELAAGVSAERFIREIRMAASLQQANIVPVLASGESGGLPYFTMPFVEGESLRARIGRDGPLPLSDVLGIARDVGKALAYAHSRGIVHRDIKPDNVLLSGGTAVVTDFGIAKAISASRTHAEGATLTQLGTSIGTPAYMSPEQAAGDPDVDHRADIYAFGCMLYELLAGRPPFHGRTPQRVLAAHMGEAPEPIGALRADTPASLGDLVMQCLEKDAARRPQSASDVIRVVENVTSGGQAVLPGVVMAPPAMLKRALLSYAVGFIALAIVTKAAIIVLGLPDWVFPGAIGVMALGLPAILMTGYVQRVATRALVSTPARTTGGSVQQQGSMATLALRASPHVTWRRTWRAGGVAIGVFVLLVAAFMITRALGIGPAGSLLGGGKLQKREPLLVADFRTSGSDSALGGVLAEAMRTSLGQSRAVSVVPMSATVAALQRMQKPTASQIDLALARAIAQREGIKVIVAGTVAPLSGGYAVSARLVNAQTGDDLASAQETVNGAADLIPAIDKISRTLRERIGESIKGIRANPPLERVTTSSLEALRKFTEARQATLGQGDYTRSVALLREAVQLDSTFAMAYRQLAGSLVDSRLGTLSERQSVSAKAYLLRDRLPEAERLLVEAFNFGSASPHPDRAKYVAAYETLVERYPETPGVLNTLANEFEARGEWARAESTWKQAQIVEPSSQFALLNDARSKMERGAFAEARAEIEVAAKRFPDLARVIESRGDLAFAERRLDSAAAQYALLEASKDTQYRANGLFESGAVRYMRGQTVEGWRMIERARGLDSARGVRSFRVEDALTLAEEYALMRDNPVEAAKRVDAALARDPFESLPVDRRLYFRVARVLAQAGRLDRANAILAQYDADVRDSVQRRVAAPDRTYAEAWIDLAAGRPRDAVVKFRQSARLPDGPRTRCTVCIDVDVARAFDRANMPDSAIAALERFATSPQVNLFRAYTTLPWAIRRLGELYQAKGDRARASHYLTRFVDLWKDADPDLQPAVRDARLRLAALAKQEVR